MDVHPLLLTGSTRAGVEEAEVMTRTSPNLRLYMSQGELSQTQHILLHTEHDYMTGWSLSTPWTVSPSAEEGDNQHRPGEARPQYKVVAQVEEVANRTTTGKFQTLTASLESLD
jgi:hypothetical protein